MSRTAWIVSVSALVVLALVLVAIPIILKLSPQNASTSDTGAVAPTPIHPLSAGSEGKRILKTTSETATFYWLYGKIISVDQVASDGIHTTFALDGDPYQTRLTVVLVPQSGMYRVRSYDAAYKSTSETFVDVDTVRKDILESGEVLEFRVPIKRLTPEDEVIISGLEGVNGGNWKGLPTSSILYAETVAKGKTQ